MQCHLHNSGVPQKKEAERIEFEKLPNSTKFVIWKMNFKSGVCSSKSFPTEAVVWINESDSPDMWTNLSRPQQSLDEKIQTGSCSPRFEKGVSTWKSKRHNRTIGS